MLQLKFQKREKKGLVNGSLLQNKTKTKNKEMKKEIIIQKYGVGMYSGNKTLYTVWILESWDSGWKTWSCTNTSG